MTLDIENRLIQYNIIHGYAKNGRTNEQKSYHNKDQTYGIFCEIVDWLVKNSGGRFKSIETIKRESTFMASPLMDLTDEQKQSKSDIQDAINQAIGEASEQYATTKHKLLIVYGSAGTGKTVLASSLFFNLLENKQLNSYFLVNHKELFNAYSTQFDAWKLSRSESKTNAIYFAPTFVNSCEKESLNPDVLLVDEAHLLKENGLGGRRMEKPDLASVISSAKVTVLMFDPKQFVDKSKQWAANWQIEDSNSDDEKKNLIATAFQSYVKKHEIDGVDISVYLLKQQMRMQNCTDDTMRWISKLWTENSSIEPPICNQVKCDEERKAWFFTDTKGYEIRIFATMEGLKNAIVEKKKTDNPSSLLATFSWPYKNKDGKPAYIDEALDLKWHYTGKGAAQQDKNAKEKAATNQIWTLSDHVDVGSYHNIQGFDLNYAGVIIGDVFTYSNGKITIDTTKRPMNKNIKRESDVNKTKELISNELKVLLTRGIKGLYIYATNTALRTALWNAVNAAASQSSSQSSRQAEANKGTANNTAEVR